MTVLNEKKNALLPFTHQATCAARLIEVICASDHQTFASTLDESVVVLLKDTTADRNAGEIWPFRPLNNLLRLWDEEKKKIVFIIIIIIIIVSSSYRASTLWCMAGLLLQMMRPPSHSPPPTPHSSLHRCWTTRLMGSQWGGTMLANNNAHPPTSNSPRSPLHLCTYAHLCARWRALVLPHDGRSLAPRLSSMRFSSAGQIGLYVN